MKSPENIFPSGFFFFIRNEIYIDNYKVHENDERSFPKKQNLIKARLYSSTIQWLVVELQN